MSTFRYDGRDFELFDHPYNATLTNERAVEIPIAIDFMERAEGDAGLEVGNVLDHYTTVVGNDWVGKRRIVDRYEQGRCDNIDVFEIGGKYDWIVSVSTLEHVRQGEPGVDDNAWASAAAMLYLRGLLNAGGRMLLTAGLGQNPTFDRFLAATGQGVTYRRWRHPDPRQSVWELSSQSVYLLPYGPDHGANAVWIGEWQS